jgi:5-methylthioadenosine/S-adenosylhomocysteine deaminase
MRLLLEGASVVTVDIADTVLDRADIEVTNGVISAIGSDSIDPRSVDRRIDVSGMVVMPGIVNAHTHLFQTLIRGLYQEMPFTDWLRAIYRCGPTLTTSSSHMAARLGSYEAIRAGVTTVVEHQFLNRDTDLAAATIEAMRDTGVRTVLARTIMDGGDLVPPEIAESPEAGLRSVERLLSLYQPRLADSMLSIMTGPNTPGVSASGDLVRAVAAFAAEHGLHQSMHLAESATVVDSVKERYGANGVVEWLEGLGALGPRVLAAHCVHLSSREIQIMAERNVSVSHNPISNMFLGDGVAPVTELLAAGVNVALGTDGASSNNSQDMFEVMKISGLLQRVKHQDGALVPPAQAIRMATFNGARAIGLDHLIGSVEVGKRADLIVLDLATKPHNVAIHDVASQIVYCAKSTDVSFVMVDGRPLMERGVLVDVDEETFLAEAQRAGDQLARALEI